MAYPPLPLYCHRQQLLISHYGRLISDDPALGALAGLITAIALCFFSGLSSGTTGMIITLKSGEYLFKVNDTGNKLFVVTEGEVDILLPYGKHHYKRLAKFGPGSFLGEIAFMKAGACTADAKAITDAELLMLNQEAFQHLREQSPETAIKLLIRLGNELSERLRWSDKELHRLAE